MLFRLRLGALLLFGFSVLDSQAQQRDLSSKANPKDCYRTFPGDSVELYYNADYQLTPKACAAIRRNTHLDASGTFAGVVRDYRLADNRPLNRQHYRGGRRNGLYELYHPNGQAVVRGQFQNGEPTGVWQFWYANGQARQTLMWGDGPEQTFRILAYWDSTGTQLCKNGHGTWRGAHANGYIRFGGPVADGLPHGTWTSEVIRTGAPFSEERYEQGRFVEGFDLTNKRYRYLGPAGLLPTVAVPTAFAEQFELNQPCEQLAAEASRRNHRAVAPQAPGSLSDYNARLLNLLRKHAEADHGVGMKGRITLLVNVGKSGQLTLDESSRDVQYARPIMDMLNRLPQWAPATLDGQPVPGQLEVEMEISSATVSSRVWPTVKPQPPKAPPL